MYFKDYGTIEWLEPNKYFAEPWKYLETAKGKDGKLYDIVIRGDYPCELRYTKI